MTELEIQEAQERVEQERLETKQDHLEENNPMLEAYIEDAKANGSER